MKYMKKTIASITVLFTSLVPFFAFAQTKTGYCAGASGKPQVIADVFRFFTCLISDSIIPLIFTLALLYFIYGIVEYFLNPSAGDKKREEGRTFMVWGLVALFVMVSVWGLVAVLTKTFNTGGVVVPILPTK